MTNASWFTYQIGLDGLYMAQPFFMELANALDDAENGNDYINKDDFNTYLTVAGKVFQHHHSYITLWQIV